MSDDDVELLSKRVDELEAQLDRLSSERTIAQVMYRYVHACDEVKQADAVAAFFTDDAVWEGQGNFAEFRSTRGREAIHRMFLGNPTMLPFTAHFLTNPDIKLAADGERAWARWHTLEAATLKDRRTQVWMAAWYENDFVRVDGEWLISHLRYRDRFVCPYDEGWAKVRYISPRNYEVIPGHGHRHEPGGYMSLASMLVGSSAPEELKDWYRRAFEPDENDAGALVFGSMQLFIEDHSEVSGPSPDPARCILNLDVDDCRAIEAHLDELGATFVRRVEQEDFGLIGTIADPDGNYVQIIEWGADPTAGHGR